MMGYYRIALIFSSLLVTFASSKEYVPVLLLGSIESPSNGISVSALSKLAGDEFKDYLVKMVHNNEDTTRPPVLLVFAEESLSVEDFSWANVGDYGVYPRLMNITRPSNSVFLPAVHQPLKALEGLTGSGFKWIKYTPTQILMTITAGKDKVLPKVDQDVKGIIVYIDLEDANPTEDRPDMLRRHDTLIVDTFEKLRGDRELIVVYAANHSSWYDTEGEEFAMNILESEDEDYVRERRSSARRLLAEADEKADDNPVIYTTGKDILVYSNSFPVFYNNSDSPGIVLNKPPIVSLDTRPNGSTSIRLNFPVQGLAIGMHFEMSTRSYWNLKYMDLSILNVTDKKVILKPSMVIEAPRRFSYHCAQPISFTNTTEAYKIVFNGMQVQAFMEDAKMTFGDGYDCVYFFTAAIWSGLFVTFLLGLILTWGLSMIMSIRTMDRFDDPKGKTITIGAAE
ncbi:V-type proton ATPase subunit S1 [Hetaerina americana]|uniref:V-type proton ATPase subunit S1 n=1 Tax=Hetaerina americana TaxID=62018 RepID=UPI003A7F3074